MGIFNLINGQIDVYPGSPGLRQHRFKAFDHAICMAAVCGNRNDCGTGELQEYIENVAEIIPEKGFTTGEEQFEEPRAGTGESFELINVEFFRRFVSGFPVETERAV